MTIKLFALCDLREDLGQVCGVQQQKANRHKGLDDVRARGADGGMRLHRFGLKAGKLSSRSDWLITKFLGPEKITKYLTVIYREQGGLVRLRWGPPQHRGLRLMGSAGRWRRWEFKSFARDVDRI